MELTDKKAVFLGDSITQGVGTSDEEHIYLNLLADMAELDLENECLEASERKKIRES